ncbi:MAG TPA: lysoplasmalogenase family protein [Candidatus Hydrogenedentes bacterium]|nr:lysoplasmalogenase family protein [Candidatus Hydrogenedentota bacterium]HPG66114.1 lysoplasmalogenase family protein [Candidatus Hydrogenedentota bacterium]
MMPLLASVVYIVLALVGTGTNLIHLDVGAGVVKSLPALFLVGCAWAYSRPRFGLWIAVAVALGAVGDYSLANAERAWFMTGLCAFLGGHVAYSVAFAKDLRWTRARGTVIGVTMLAMAALVAVVAVHMARAGESGLIAPVIVYVVVMAVMMALGLLHESPTQLIAAGGIVFVVSDGHIAVNHMLLSAPQLGITLSGYATYYLAQYLLVAGAVSEARPRA